MAMKRCSNGHFYDDAKHPQCPYCKISAGETPKTVPIIQPKPQSKVKEETRTVALTPEEAQRRVAKSTAPADDQKTVGIMKKEKGIDPVVGWIVCIDGPMKGQDFKIKAERNFVGRDVGMDIAITKDLSISRENHAIISYNPKNSVFRIIQGDSRGMVYLNDEEVLVPTEIVRGDIIEMGQSKFIFVPLCEGGFVW